MNSLQCRIKFVNEVPKVPKLMIPPEANKVITYSLLNESPEYENTIITIRFSSFKGKFCTIFVDNIVDVFCIIQADTHTHLSCALARISYLIIIIIIITSASVRTCMHSQISHDFCVTLKSSIIKCAQLQSSSSARQIV